MSWVLLREIGNTIPTGKLGIKRNLVKSVKKQYQVLLVR
jgi:hypothetical protein